MSMGQMIEDVKLSVNGKKPVYFYGRTGGMVPQQDAILEEIKKNVLMQMHNIGEMKNKMKKIFDRPQFSQRCSTSHTALAARMELLTD